MHFAERLLLRMRIVQYVHYMVWQYVHHVVMQYVHHVVVQYVHCVPCGCAVCTFLNQQPRILLENMTLLWKRQSFERRSFQG